MVFLDDPITDVATTRFQTEEEEELAQQLTQQYQTKPTIEVFLVGPAAALLASTFLRQAKAIGSITVPELQRLRSPYDEEYGTPTMMHTSAVLRLTDTMAVVASDKFLPAEQAVAWAAAVMGTMQPSRAVVATTIAAMDYRGPGSPADEDLIFLLQTTAAASSSGGSILQAPPPLPSGTLLGGLPAAILSLCNQQQLAAAAVVGVQLGAAPDAKFVRSLAEAVQAVLGSLGLDIGPHVSSGSELLAEIGAATDRLYRGSTSNSIFI